VLAVLLSPYLPASTERLLAALGAEDTSLEGAVLGRGTISAVETVAALFPKEPREAGAA
jgi:methionyl-tRNA synthetase